MTQTSREKIRSLTRDELAVRLRRGLRIQQGPFVVRLRGYDKFLAERLHQYYPNYPVVDDSHFADADIEVCRNPSLSRSWFSTRSIRLDDGLVFMTFPADQVVAQIEWSTNWFIAMRMHQFLMFHAATVANDQGAVIMPGLPGAGKSTLCAYLIHRGWRLLSDEFTLLRDESLAIHPYPRAIPLKNQSIEVIRELVPEAQIAPAIPDTHKGTVAHLCPPELQLDRMLDTAAPKLVIFPAYQAGAQVEVTAVSEPSCFVELSKHSFNYVMRGLVGFQLTGALANTVVAYRLVYSDLAAAAAKIAELMDAATA